MLIKREIAQKIFN